MSYKIATYVTLLFVIALATLFLFTSTELMTLQSNQPINPATFPQIISVLLIIMSVVSFVNTRKQKDEKVEMTNFRTIAYTVVAIIVFVILWELIGYFYLLMNILLATLFYLYNDSRDFKRKVFSSLTFAVIVAALIYIVFNRILSVIF